MKRRTLPRNSLTFPRPTKCLDSFNSSLTDEEARKTFDEFGHPDGKQAFQLGVALPKWLVESGSSSFVLLVYSIAFGIGLPFVVASWWKRAKITSKNSLLNETMAIFYQDLKENSEMVALIEIIIKAKEYQSLFSNFTISKSDWKQVCGQLNAV